MAKRGRKPGFQMDPEHRTKIANSQILKRLIEFSEGKIEPEKYPPHRVTASLGLLRKIMPDLQQTDVTSDGDKIELPGVIVLQAAKTEQSGN